MKASTRLSRRLHFVCPWTLVVALCNVSGDVAAVSLEASTNGTDDDPPACPIRERLDKTQCFGLEYDAAARSAVECERRCCAEAACEVWQFHRHDGCFRGDPYLCGGEYNSPIAREGIGARVRHRGRKDELSYEGYSSYFSNIVEVDPQRGGSEPYHFHLENQDAIFRARRKSPASGDLEVLQFCWNRTVRPYKCCHSPGARSCWRASTHMRACCTPPHGAEVIGDYGKWFLVDDLLEYGRRQLDQALPRLDIDIEAYNVRRNRWRFGTAEPAPFCSNRGANEIQETANRAPEYNGSLEEATTGVTLRLLVQIFLQEGFPLSRSFVNIGAGTCGVQDPLTPLLKSTEAKGFVGLAVESNMSDLGECVSNLEGAVGDVLPVALALDPVSVHELLPHLDRLFPRGYAGRAPLDILVIDIDGCDCLVVEEMLEITIPKVVVLEMGYHIPPPFRYSMQFDPSLAQGWQENYDVRRFNAFGGCSLSYAVHRLGKRGYYLLRLTYLDVIFIHNSMAPMISRRLGVQFPQDEFECYRRSLLWISMVPGSFTRDWFWGSDPFITLGRIWRNVSEFARQLGLENQPFSLDF